MFGVQALTVVSNGIGSSLQDRAGRLSNPSLRERETERERGFSGEDVQGLVAQRSI